MSVDGGDRARSCTVFINLVRAYDSVPGRVVVLFEEEVTGVAEMYVRMVKEMYDSS